VNDRGWIAYVAALRLLISADDGGQITRYARLLY